MAFPKQIRDIAYKLLTEPTLDHFREFIKEQTGEHDAIDFKEQWIDRVSLVKEMVSIANTGGGVIIFGVKENKDNTFDPSGLEVLKDKNQISNDIKGFISSNLKYYVYDFEYSSAEYEKLQGRKFQMIHIENTPGSVPFLVKREGGDGNNKVFSDRIYIRKGTSCESANEEEIRNLIERRIEHIGQPLNSLNFKNHLEQLEILYSKIERNKATYRNSGVFDCFSDFKNKMSIFTGGREIIPNPLYPDKDYEEYISDIISKKKKRIERVLDL